MTKIKLTRIENAGYKCKAVYEWNGHTIEGDDVALYGGKCYWYCDTLFKGRAFRTLKGLKKAIELKVENKLTNWQLEECEDM
jgi:hypothetical protein